MAVLDVTERPVVWLGPVTFRTLTATGVAGSGGVGTASLTAAVAADAVASSGGVGSVSVTVVASPDGVAGSSDTGTVTAWISHIYPDPASSGGDVGAVAVTNFYNPIQIYPNTQVGTARAGVAAPVDSAVSTGATGSPRLSIVMKPSGVAANVAFGDADTVATVVVAPGPFEPSDGFGNTTVSKKGWVFRPPVNTYKWRLFKEYEGISLVRENGVWSEVAHPDLQRTRDAEKYLAGGRDHVVSTSLKDELVGLGYTVSEEFVTTEEYKS